MPRLAFHPIFDSYPLVAVLVALLLCLLFVRPLFPSAEPERRRQLNALRMAVIGLLGLAMLRPGLVTTDKQSQSATILFLSDASRSMNVPDVNNLTRWQAARQTLERVAPRLKRLAGKFRVANYLFDSHAIQVPSDEALPEVADGDESDIGSSLDDVLRSESGRRIAAVFLSGDGAQRAVNPRVELQRPFRELARRNIPVYALSYGVARDRSQIRDVALENLPDQYTVFVNNELEIRAFARVQGLGGIDVPVRLEIDLPDGSKEQIGPINVVTDEQNSQLPIVLSYQPTEVGQYKLNLIAEPRPGEQILDNNQLTAFMTVLDGGLRILYVDGNIGWQERKFLRRALDESPDIQVDTWLDSNPRGKGALPIPLDEQKPYDVYLIGDIDASRLGNVTAVAISSAVSEGQGFMMLGGIHSFGPGGYAKSPLADALPVRMERLERQAQGEAVRTDVHFEQEMLMLPTSDHFLTRIGPPSENITRWSNLPPLLGANRFRGLKDQALVIAESPDKHPLLISGNYGSGRVLAFAGDTTFRWYRRGFQEEHKRFWRQAMLWLARKDETAQNQVWLRMTQRRFRAGATVSVTMGARDSAGETIDDAEFKLMLRGPNADSSSVRVKKTVGEQGSTWSATSDKLTQPGEYRFSLTATRNGEELGTDQGGFVVIDQDIEMADPAANTEQLKALAELTTAAGGKLIIPEQLESILAELGQQPVESELEFKTQWQLADTSLDASVFYLLLIGLLVFEWFLRKKWGMV